MPLDHLILASGSATRAAMLRAAGLTFEVVVPRVDEAALKAALLAERTSPRDLSDALAEIKASRVARRRPGALVLGCDQVLSCDGRILSKPVTVADAHEQLEFLMERTHKLHSAAVIHLGSEPIWRHVAEARMTMGRLSAGWIETYLSRNWQNVRQSVGAYQIEGEGVRLFTQIEGDHFTILGLPLLPLLSFLSARGSIPS